MTDTVLDILTAIVQTAIQLVGLGVFLGPKAGLIVLAILAGAYVLFAAVLIGLAAYATHEQRRLDRMMWGRR